MSVAAEQDVVERAAAPREGEAPAAPAESAGRMLAIAFGCMLLALGCAFALSFLAGFFVGRSERLAQSAADCLASNPSPTALMTALGDRSSSATAWTATPLVARPNERSHHSFRFHRIGRS